MQRQNAIWISIEWNCLLKVTSLFFHSTKNQAFLQKILYVAPSLMVLLYFDNDGIHKISYSYSQLRKKGFIIIRAKFNYYYYVRISRDITLQTNLPNIQGVTNL